MPMGDTIHAIEAVVTDCIARKIGRYLTDVGVEYTFGIGNFEARVRDTAGCDFGVSIHADWCTNKALHGYHCIHYGSRNGGKLALCLDACMNVIADRARAPHTRRDLAILWRTAFPVCLVEVGFLSNVEEESALMQEDLQYRFAMTIAMGIMRYVYNGGYGG